MCSTLVAAAAAADDDDDEGDDEGTEVKLISWAPPVAYSGLWQRWIGSVGIISRGKPKDSGLAVYDGLVVGRVAAVLAFSLLNASGLM